MEEPDYYTVMESRIKFLAWKYDPENKFHLEWEKERDSLLLPVPDTEPEEEELYKSPVIKRFAQMMSSVVAFFL
jgi:hypothetical protein